MPTSANNRATTLPGKYYTDQEIYKRESEKIFSREWIYVGREAAVKEAGDFFIHSQEGERIIIVRGGDGGLRAFFDLCRHRGTGLCSTDEGRFGKYITCPYHAWSYALDGKLVSTPNMDETEGFQKEDYPLKSVACRTLLGAVFINLCEDPLDFETLFTPLAEKFRPWGIADLRLAPPIEYDIAANWKLIIQNYSECYHCPTVHPALNELSPFRATANDLEEGPLLGGPMEITRPGGGMTTTGERCAAHLPGLEGADLQRAYYYLVFPNMLVSLQPDFVLVHRLTRRGPARSMVTCEWLYHPDAISGTDFDPGPAVEFWDETNRQDWEICERSQRGVSSRAYTPGPYSSLETMLPVIDNHYLTAMS